MGLILGYSSVVLEIHVLSVFHFMLFIFFEVAIKNSLWHL